MSKLQLIVVSSAVLLLGILYFGFDTKTKSQSKVEQSRSLTKESTGIQSLLKDAKSKLQPAQILNIQELEQVINDEATDETQRIETLKKLSGAWYDYQFPEVAGFYAEEIAGQVNDDQVWSIAGTTYALGLKQSKEEKVRDYCMGRAVKAFENAISLNPDNIDHQVNLAICYTDSPPQDNPMKGILMLVDLVKKHPENVGVLTNLGRLAIQTGQFEKAVQRLEKAVSLEANNPKSICLLAEAYKGLGKNEEANEYIEKCRSFSSN